jgi:hypothetical protein
MISPTHPLFIVGVKIHVKCWKHCPHTHPLRSEDSQPNKCQSPHFKNQFYRCKIFGLGLASLEHLQWCSVCDPPEIFLTSKFNYLLSWKTPPPPPLMKLTSEHQMGGGTSRYNSKPPGTIITLGRSETLSSSQIYVSTIVACAACWPKCELVLM